MHRSTRSSRSLRMLVAAALVVVLSGVGGCGMDAQTLQSYTPAHGVNIDEGFLKVRNLLVIANEDGRGRLSASLTSQREPDALIGVTGTAVKPDGTQGSPLTITRVSVPLRPGQLVVLTGEGAPTIQVSGADLKPGLSAILTLTFSSGVTRTITVPVMSAADPIYATVMPRTATAQPSGTATPAP